ncbi:MAG: rod-binding protein [Planctomyces sp.]|nr:rod-binding protein [Planctomyces sp.]
MTILPAASMPSMLAPIDPELSPGDGGPEAIQNAVKQFEAVFASLLIKTMRETMTSGEMFGGDTADVWGALFDQHMGEAMTQGDGLGLMKQYSAAIAAGPPPASTLSARF